MGRLKVLQDEIIAVVQENYRDHVTFSCDKIWLEKAGINLNVITCKPAEILVSKPLTMMHGYAFGGAPFAVNMAEIANVLKRVVYAVDWPGFGLSDKPEFTATNVQETMEYFFKPFDEWRQVMGFDSIDLLGHSMGGYFVGLYCRYYGHVENLMLASPYSAYQK